MKYFVWLLSIILFVLGPSFDLAAATENYYDDLHRLTRVEHTDGSVTVYNYDDFGNRTSVVTTNSTVDTDQDGIADYLDAFPNDPAASEDTDGDGYPDQWNNGYSQADSTTGLSLDEFIHNPAEWVDSDGDGAGDNSDVLPLNPNKKWQYPILSAGQFHTAVIQPDGTLWTWGSNSRGQLGDGTKIDQYSPIQVGFDNDWMQVVSGAAHTLALKTDGSLWGWGYNASGQLGLGVATTDQLSPIQSNSGNSWSKIESGYYHAFGFKSDGSLWAWGKNDHGELGDGSTISRNSPVLIGNDWAKVSAGWQFSVAVKKDGTLWAWGSNDTNQLGDGTTIDRIVPIQIGSDGNWATVSAGSLHSLSLKSDGTLWAWGNNGLGQLGDGTTIAKTSPVQIGVDNNWMQISAGNYTSQALKLNGSRWGWGNNYDGQLGNDSATSYYVSTQVDSDFDWIQIDAGATHTLALKASGTVLAWGINWYGQLGDGSIIDRHIPTQIFIDNVGSISVTISPQEAIDDGAQWRVDGGTWQNSGAVVNNLDPGLHEIEFSTVSGWVTPLSQITEVLTNTTTTNLATYIPVVTTGFGKISEGLSVLPAIVTLDHDFTVDFTITETLGAPITYEQIVVAILDADGNHLFDIPQTFSDVILTANGTWSGSVTGNIFSSNLAGEYQAVLRGKVSGGDWFDFETVSPGINPVSFNVVEDPIQPGDRIRVTSTDGISEVDPAWAPDGSRILYQATNIFTNNLTGDDPVQVTFLPDPRHAWGGVYRPNTDRIYYLDNSYPTGLDYWWICWTNADGSAGRNQVWMVPGGQSISPISFSPDGNQFVFIHRQEMALYIMNADGTLDHKISGISAEGNVSWGRGASSNKLLYNIKIGDVYTLNVIDVDGSHNTQLTDVNMGSCNYPSWTPDGSAVVFSRTSDNQIYRMNLDRTELTALTNDQYINVYPEISPNGNTLLYASKEEGGFYDIYQLNLNNAVEQRILFEDSFNDGVIDPEKWTTDGYNVIEANGYLSVTADVTDQFGKAYSNQINLVSTAPIVFEQRIFVHYANNYSRQFLQVCDFDDNPLVWITHYNYHYTQDCYGFGFGFTCPGELMPPVWDQWIDEKFIYDPVTGYVEYYINGQGPLAEYHDPLPGNTFSFKYSAWGWYTGHYMLIDHVKVYQSTAQADQDNDGIYDFGDNCVDTVNPDQNDANTNDIGDACDLSDTDSDGLTDAQEYILGTNPTNPDSDGDSISDGIDNCPLTANTLQSDANSNNIGDACDQSDTDYDGLIDAQEYVLGTDPNNPDTDWDGVSDGYEINCTADPLDPESTCNRGMPWLQLLLDDDN